MMNAAMMIAPAPQMGNPPSGGKMAAGQGQLFGQAMAQQEQEMVYQTSGQEQSGLSGQPGRGVQLNNFSELLGKDVSEFLALQPQQQDLLEQLDQLDMEMLDGLALLLDQGMVPNSMDHAQLQQLVDLVEEVLPGWQFHNQVVAEQTNEKELLPEQQILALERKVEELPLEQKVEELPLEQKVEELPLEQKMEELPLERKVEELPLEQKVEELPLEQKVEELPLEQKVEELPLEQKVEELIAWLSQVQEQQVQHFPGRGIAGELPPGQLVAVHKLEQVRERLTQLRATLSEAGNSAYPVKAEGEAKGMQMATAAVRGTEMAGRKESSGSPLEARFSELLKPRQLSVGQPQTGENGRQVQQINQPQQAQQTQQMQQASINQPPAEASVEALFAKVVDRGAPQVPLVQATMNAKQGIEGITQQHNHLHAQPSPVAAAAHSITAPTAVAAPFAASQQVVDSQIFDQVVTHLSGSDKGDMGRMVLRLHPVELGALRIELMVEGDKVRANLHAQTQQVQEVLERNLGQLRNALAEQGLKIDHFQVSSDARQNQHQGQAQDLAHQRREAEQSARTQRDKKDALQEDQAIPLAHLIQNGGRGISLHV